MLPLQLQYYIIIIDDRGEYRERQVHNLSSTLLPPLSSYRCFLICRRAEPHLTLGFTSFTSGGMATRLSLDDGYGRNADINRYLVDPFPAISTTLPLKKYIRVLPEWLTHIAISILVDSATEVKCTRHQTMRRLKV